MDYFRIIILIYKIIIVYLVVVLIEMILDAGLELILLAVELSPTLT
jgi:hypothetical protein